MPAASLLTLLAALSTAPLSVPSAGVLSAGLATPDDSLEALLRRAREHELALQAALRPRIDRIALGFEGLSQPPKPEVLAALHAEVAALGDEALPILVPWIDPGRAPEPPAEFRAAELTRALARRDLSSAAPTLIWLSHSGSPRGRRNAVVLLGHTPVPQARVRLQELFEGDDAELRRAAALALSLRPAPERAAFLQSALSDPDPELVGAVLAGLAAEPDALALEPVFALLARPAAAAPWMEPILVYLAAVGPLPEARLVALVDLTLDERLTGDVRAALVEVLTRAGSALPKAQEKRLEALTRAGDLVLREAALVCLARLGDRGARRELLRAYDEQVEKNGRWPTAFQKRADVLLRIGEPREAVEDYRRAIELVRDQGRRPAAELWIALARAWLRDGRLRQAHDVLLEGGLEPAELAALAADADFRSLREHPRYGRVFTN